MNFSPFIPPLAVLFIISFNHSYAQSARDTLATLEQDSVIAEDKIAQLSVTCHQKWQSLNWKLGQQNMPAANNPAFNAGIKKLCRARAELFFEGYELSPFIQPDTQSQVFPFVFHYSVDEIKAEIRLHLPKLRLI